MNPVVRGADQHLADRPVGPAHIGVRQRAQARVAGQHDGRGDCVGADGQDRDRGQQEADVHQRMRPERGQDAEFFLRVVHGVQPPQRGQPVIAQVREPVGEVNRDQREDDEAPARHAWHSGQHQPRRQPGQPGREAGADQHDQRHDHQRVGQQVAHVDQVPAGQQRPPDGRPDLLEQEDQQHEPQDGRPGQFPAARVDRAGQAEVAELRPAPAGQVGRRGGDDQRGQADPAG